MLVLYGHVDALEALNVRRNGSEGHRAHDEARRRRAERAREEAREDEEAESGRRGADRRD